MNKRRVIILSLLTVLAIVMGLLVLPGLRQKAEAKGCGNQMIAIGYAARMWAEDNGGYFPPDLLSLSNEIIATKILICPADHSQPPASNWSSLTSNNCSYGIVSTGLRAGDTSGVFMRCQIHGSILRADGAAFNGTERLSKGVR